MVKSLLFTRRESGTPLLVLTSGANRVDEALIGKLLGEPIGRATPEQVREATGFAIGGVPPIGHATPVETLIDEDLLGFEDVWAAAGNPNAVFKLMSADLPKMTSGRTVRVK
ncbi:MAG TPA: YbaK/EbsC family protein [Chloroflexota bacterium]